MPSAHRSRRTLALMAAVALVATGCSGTPNPSPTTPPVAATSSPSGAASSGSATASQSGTLPTGAPTDIVTGLDVPWAIAFLPDGDALVTLRDRAEVLRISPSGERTSLGRVDGVEAEGEGGLLGVAVSPTFATDSVVHLYLTSARDNRVVRTTLGAQGFGPMTPVLTGIPKATFHNGGRLRWGPDGHLYVTTGDAGERGVAQDRDDLGGKILRITADGDPAPGNPYGDSPVWSLGHRNVQGIGWAPDGTMFASEFGQNTWDELNVITPGANYGWPEVEGVPEDDGQDFVAPIAQWATSDASPSGLAVGADGAVYMAALRGESLWKVTVAGARVAGDPVRLFEDRFGRLRDAVPAPDGTLWVLTNNTSRDDPREGDDRILRVPIG